jgi:hypothetical protein
MTGEHVGAALLIGVVILVVALQSPPSSINGLKAIKEETSHFHVLRGKGDADGTVTIKGTVSGERGSFVLDEGQIFENPKDLNKDYTLSFTPDNYFIDPHLDIGTWAGYRSSHSPDVPSFETGIRYSPVRIGFGTVAPDLVFNDKLVGAGISVYPPTRVVGNFWRHIGLGAWYTVPTHSDSDVGPGWCYGLSFSTRY